MNNQPARKRGRPSGDNVERQREIANVLLRVIGEHGFEKASLRLVAREANCSTGVLAHYFSSKEDLVYHAVELMFDWAEQRTIASMASGDSIKAIRQAVGTSEEAEQPPFDFWAGWLQILARAKRNPRLTEIVAKRHGRFRDLLTQIVKQGQENGQIRTDIAADLLADHINAVSDGLGLMGPIETKRLTRERKIQMLKMSIDYMRLK